MSNADNFFFILFWYYYDTDKPILSKEIDEYRFIKDVKSNIFISKDLIETMLDNYKKYIGGVIFDYAGNKSELLANAQVVLNSKFYTVGRRIVGGLIVKMNLDALSFIHFLQKSSSKDLYLILQEEFSIMEAQGREYGYSEVVRKHQEFFTFPARYIWNNSEKLFGLAWLVTQPPRLIVLYLHGSISTSQFWQYNQQLVFKVRGR